MTKEYKPSDVVKRAVAGFVTDGPAWGGSAVAEGVTGGAAVGVAGEVAGIVAGDGEEPVEVVMDGDGLEVGDSDGDGGGDGVADAAADPAA